MKKYRNFTVWRSTQQDNALHTFGKEIFASMKYKGSPLYFVVGML
jgi:hypothetical protein